MASPATRDTVFGDVPAESPPGAELGAPLQQIGPTNGWAPILDPSEYVAAWTFPQSIRTAHQMRSDSQVEALHLGTTQPVREFRWSIDPNGAPAKLVEQVSKDFGLPVKGHEDDTVERRQATFDFDSYLEDCLLGPLYGFMHHEIAGDIVEASEWRMQRLSPRHPRTISDFKLTPNGDLEAIRQNISGQSGWNRLPPPIPAWKLITHIWRSEAGSQVGRSLLRSLYREWQVKDRTVRVAAINIQRAGGVPVIEAADGASDDQIKDLAQLARQFKVAEGGGGAIPFGSKLSLVGGSVPDAIALLKYCDEAMARVWALMLIQLGTTQGANRALGGEFAVYAARAQRMMAGWVKAPTDRFFDRYVEWNDPFATHAPLLHFEQSKPDGLSVTDLVAEIESGALTVDPELEAWLRNEQGLPTKPTPPHDEELGDLSPEEVALVQNSRNPPALPAPADPKPPSPTQDPTAIDPTIASSGYRFERRWRGIVAALQLPERKLHREPTENEIRAAVNFRALDQTHAQITSSLQEGFLDNVVPGQVTALGDAIRLTKTGAERKTVTKADMAKIMAPADGVDLVTGKLMEAARAGAATASEELLAQGIVPTSPSDDVLAARIADQAKAIVELAANGLSLTAQRKASSLVSEGGRSPKEIASAVEDHLGALKNAWTKEQLKGAVTMAQNQGRIATFVEAQSDTEPTYEASELLDDRTCDPCEAVDGTVFESLEVAMEAYAAGGYVECEGGPNCRGTLIAIYPEQNPLSDSNPVGGEGAEYVQPEPALA